MRRIPLLTGLLLFFFCFFFFWGGGGKQAVPSLRSDSALIQFNRQLKRCDYDLNAWRAAAEARAGPDLRRGLELLDLDGGIGWELLTSMVRYKARQRTSAKGALAHPYFKREGLMGLSFMQSLRLQLFRATQKDYSEAAKWVISLMARSGTEKEGGFTEAQLQDLRVSQFNPPAQAFLSLVLLRSPITHPSFGRAACRRLRRRRARHRGTRWPRCSASRGRS